MKRIIFRLAFCLMPLCILLLSTSCIGNTLPSEIGEAAGPEAHLVAASKEGISTESEAEKANVSTELKENEKNFPEADFKKEEINLYDDDEKMLLLSGRIVYPTVKLHNNVKAEGALKDFFDKEKEAYFSEAKRMLAESRELLNSDTEYWNTFILNLEYRISMVSENYISFIKRIDSYTGGAHSTPTEFGITFDLESGNALTENDLFFSPGDFYSFACSEIIPQIDRSALLTDSLEAVPSLTKAENICFGRNGIIFICNVYVLFPYSHGIQYFTIPYDKLGKYLIPSIDGGTEFSKFYGFDLDGEDSASVIGYIDSREALCPYDATETVELEGKELHACYIVPKYTGSNVSIEQLTYDENGSLSHTENIRTFENTEENFCLKLLSPIPEALSLYRVTITKGADSGSIDISYSSAIKKPVKLILK